MTPEARRLMEESYAASKALAAWFDSQGLDMKQSLGVMAVLTAEFIAKEYKGDPISTLARLIQVKQLTESMTMKNMIDYLAGGDDA